MISMSELLREPLKLEDLSQEYQDNLALLLERMNKVREAYGKPMTVTSGFRSMEDHLRIYAAKGITDPAKIPMKSAHLRGCAVDISDPNGEVFAWCQANEPLLVEIGIWLENRQKNWQHFQVQPFASYKDGGTIWFNP
jgi:hypothetical protein